MNKLKKFIPIIVIALIIGLIYSFFNINGREIKNVNKLTDAKYVAVYVRNETQDEKEEYRLDEKQKKLLQTLLKENSYTRRLSSTIIGVLPENEYTILADWNDNGKTHLYMKILGNGYIRFSDCFGTENYHRIKNIDFEKELISILKSK